MKNEPKRKFEVTEKAKWLHYSIDGLLYGVIQCYATFNQKEENENHKLYLTKQNYGIHRKEIQDYCGLSSQSLNLHLKKLVKENVLEEFDLIGDDGKTYPSYGIVVNKDCPYKLIDKNWLMYLCLTKKSILLKVYFILLNWYEYKEGYEFTKEAICKMLGYAHPTAVSYTAVDSALCALGNEGIIEYSKYYETMSDEGGKSVPVPKMRLNHVVRTLDEYSKLAKYSPNKEKISELLEQKQ